MSSENQNIVITIDQTKYQSYEYSTVLECWGLINLNILKAENQTYHLENLWGIYKQQHWYIRNYLSGVTFTYYLTTSNLWQQSHNFPMLSIIYREHHNKQYTVQYVNRGNMRKLSIWIDLLKTLKRVDTMY